MVVKMMTGWFCIEQVRSEVMEQEQRKELQRAVEAERARSAAEVPTHSHHALPPICPPTLSSCFHHVGPLFRHLMSSLFHL